MLIAERQARLGQKPQLAELEAKIDDLEMEHMTTANEAKRKGLETQINNLKLQKMQIEKRAKKALAKDKCLRDWNLEANKVNRVNVIRSWGLGMVGRPDQKDLFDRTIATGDKRSEFLAQQLLGAGGDGASLAKSSFVTQSYSGGGQQGQT